MNINVVIQFADLIGPTGCWMLMVIGEHGEWIGTDQKLADMVGCHVATIRKHRQQMRALEILDYQFIDSWKGARWRIGKKVIESLKANATESLAPAISGSINGAVGNPIRSSGSL